MLMNQPFMAITVIWQFNGITYAAIHHDYLVLIRFLACFNTQCIYSMFIMPITDWLLSAL